MVPTEPFVFQVDRAIPDLGIQAGDVLSVSPGDEEPIVASHVVEVGYDRIFREVEVGTIHLIEDHRQPSDLAAAVGLSLPSAPPQPRGHRPPSYLTRLK